MTKEGHNEEGREKVTKKISGDGRKARRKWRRKEGRKGGRTKEEGRKEERKGG